MSNIKLSFIIPVYNVEKYLNECLDSVISQCNEQCEIIIVDDGSTDNSGAICDDYKDKYENITVMHQKNSGSSIARNAGLKAAKGDYIAFIDSDDRISPDSIKNIFSAVNNNADVYFMEGKKLFPNGSSQSLGDEIDSALVRGQSKERVFEHLASRPKYPGSACTKLFKRSFLADNNLCFSIDRVYGEDLSFCLNCFLSADSFDALKFSYYEYRQNRDGSVTNVVDAKLFWGLSSFVTECAEKLTTDKTPNDKISKYSMSFAAYEYSILLWHYSDLEKSELKKALAFLKKYKWVMGYAGSKKVKAINLMSNIFGLRITSLILKHYMTLRQKRNLL